MFDDVTVTLEYVIVKLSVVQGMLQKSKLVLNIQFCLGVRLLMLLSLTSN